MSNSKKNMGSVPRNTEFYYPSTHAAQQRKHRNIAWDLVADTLASGRVKNCHKEGCKLFIKQFERYDDPVAVVASIDCGQIVTIQWRYKDD